jgi:uncharacterized membrane protein YphA (DoxX/SURF4 family)
VSAVVDIARFLTAAVFVVSGGAKLSDPSGTRRSLDEFGVPKRLGERGWWALPLVELGTAALMILERTSWSGAVLALALLAGFSAVMAASLGRGHRPECHCFGRLHSEPIGARSLLRNAVIAVPALVVILWG